MQLYTIDTGYFKLDGGAMFGVVPRTLWRKLAEPDEDNLCTWSMRCLLVESGNRLVLIDTGIGNKQDEKFRGYFQPHGDDTLKGSLAKHGFIPSDITDVLLTHLHFDHCGGAAEFDASGRIVPTFPRANYWSSRSHWEWALQPNAREKASFLSENLLPLEASGQLRFTDEEDPGIAGLSFDYVYGHTEAMIIAHIEGYKGHTISYGADLIPSRHHIRMPYVMAYDVRPLETLKEKAAFLTRLEEKGHILMFEHDRDVECCTLERTERGIVANEQFALREL